MNKMLTCIASLAPIVGVGLGIVMAIMVAFIGEGTGFAGAIAGYGFIIGSFVFVLIGVAMCWVDIIWFIVLTCKRKDWDTSMKVIWCIMIYMLNIFVFPVYWFLYLRVDE